MADISWEKPVKNLKEALTRIEKGCKTLQFEHRIDPYSDGEIDFSRGAGDKIANPHIGNEGLSEICDALLKNTKCTALDLSGNKISTEGIRSLCKLIEDNKTLEILYLEDNQINDEGVEQISEVLAKNKGIKQLCLSGNNITSKGASSLAFALKKNKTLEALWLNRNDIRDGGAKAFGKVLKKKNKTLDTLCLEENRIRERGAKRLAKSMKKNREIKTLNLGNNKINAKGARYFKEVLDKIEQKKGTDKALGLECLILDGNRINHDDLEVLKSKAANRDIGVTVQGVIAEEAPKDKLKLRIKNFLKYHLAKPKYAKQGHFDPEKEIFRVL